MRTVAFQLGSRLRARPSYVVVVSFLAVMLMAGNPSATAMGAEPHSALVASVDQDVISRSSLDLLVNYARVEDPAVTVDAVRDEWIDARLLARHAVSSFPHEVLFPEQRVAFALDVSVDERLLALLRFSFREEWDARFNRPSASVLASSILPSRAVTAAHLAAVFGSPDRLRLSETLDADEHRRASDLVVLRYRLPGGKPAVLTLDEVYRRQNVQGKIHLHNRDLEFLAAQAQQRLAELLALDWAQRKLGASVVAELRRSLSDREYARALRERHGIGADMHRGSPLVSELQARVSAADIRAWYDAHRADFRYVARVKARHIRVADELLADPIAEQARAHPDQFAELARRHSIAPDRASGGDLGWLARRADSDWFTELAFAQVPQQAGAAVREPVAAQALAHWEIVLVEDQEMADFAPDDETVRYQASRAIAVQRAHDNFIALRARLHKAAEVRKYDLAISATKTNATGKAPP